MDGNKGGIECKKNGKRGKDREKNKEYSERVSTSRRVSEIKVILDGHSKNETSGRRCKESEDSKVDVAQSEDLGRQNDYTLSHTCNEACLVGSRTYTVQ